MAEIKLPRLSNAAIEFNISMQSIVDFLGKKGFPIENRPTTKLSEEQYLALVKEYQGEKIDSCIILLPLSNIPVVLGHFQ